MKRFKSVLAIFILLFLLLNPKSYFLNLTHGQDSTPSADVQRKLDALKDQIASKAAAYKKEVSQKLQNKAFVGVIKTKSDHSLTLATKEGTKIASVTEDTEYEDSTKKVKNFDLEKITEEDQIAALGDVDDTGVLVARKIVLLPDEKPRLKTILWGQILSISDKLFIIRDRESRNISITTIKDTEIEKEGKTLTFKDLGTNDYVIVTGIFEEEKEASQAGVLESTFIYVTASGGMVKPPESTPSASVKPTPTAEPEE